MNACPQVYAACCTLKAPLMHPSYGKKQHKLRLLRWHVIMQLMLCLQDDACTCVKSCYNIIADVSQYKSPAHKAY